MAVVVFRDPKTESSDTRTYHFLTEICSGEGGLYSFPLDSKIRSTLLETIGATGGNIVSNLDSITGIGSVSISPFRVTVHIRPDTVWDKKYGIEKRILSRLNEIFFPGGINFKKTPPKIGRRKSKSHRK
jgi:hypothetical protein